MKGVHSQESKRDERGMRRLLREALTINRKNKSGIFTQRRAPVPPSKRR
jgi:hypothetical protein